MVCKNCGVECAEGTKFCTACGSTLDGQVEVISAQPQAEAAASQPTVTAAKQSTPSTVCGIISLITGILSIVACCGGPLFGIAAIILAIVAKKKATMKNGMATAGLILGIIGLALSVISIIISIGGGFFTALIEGSSDYGAFGAMLY